MIPLLEQYPLLAEKLPYVSLGEFPTPVAKLHRLGEDIGVENLYLKRDDVSGKLYGGNKTRKLEFILGHALRTDAKAVFAFGFAGSNHAVATAIYAQQVGLKSISMLMPQPNAQYVRRNLLMSHYCGAELHQHRNVPLVIMGTFYQILRHKLRYGYSPQVIPPGGSSPLGATGFVNAAFELKEQIMSGELPEPDRIYVALGTTGTAVGLMLGLKAANLKSRVISVRVADEQFANVRKMVTLFHETNSFLCSLDPSFPAFKISEKDIAITHDFFGERYALFTEEGMEAVTRMEKEEGITLDGTYTGKAVAALIADAQKHVLRDQIVLFWNTYNSRDFSNALSTVDYRQLPRCFHRYFEEEVQPLDRLSGKGGRI
ncbi:MAG: pyridoxal-phosphate dependent enzyme [Methanomicrobia archaeon]|nr:pyridoxal-phosphate dependent enzyme [Methanomicrobia archaeon]